MCVWIYTDVAGKDAIEFRALLACGIDLDPRLYNGVSGNYTLRLRIEFSFSKASVYLPSRFRRKAAAASTACCLSGLFRRAAIQVCAEAPSLILAVSRFCCRSHE